jgi:hypothetical protein
MNHATVSSTIKVGNSTPSTKNAAALPSALIIQLKFITPAGRPAP